MEVHPESVMDGECNNGMTRHRTVSLKKEPVLESSRSSVVKTSTAIESPDNRPDTEQEPLADRHANINDNAANSAHKFCDNSTSSSKYSLITFLPLTLFEQFRRVANFYFLILSILMIIGGLFPQLWFTPISYQSTFFPLLFVLTCTMVSYDKLH